MILQSDERQMAIADNLPTQSTQSVFYIEVLFYFGGYVTRFFYFFLIINLTAF